jgi:hypothetical protein
MNHVALVVRYEIKAEHRDAFEELIRDLAKRTLEAEKGCLRFDVLVPKDDSGTCTCTNCIATRMRTLNTPGVPVFLKFVSDTSTCWTVGKSSFAIAKSASTASPLLFAPQLSSKVEWRLKNI